MILLGSAVLNAEIFSIQTGGKVARTTRAIINPANLQIIAFEVSGPLVQQHPALMLLSDVRELSNMGFIVDDIDQFIAPTDVVRVNDVYQLKFDIIGKLVLDEKRHKLGKVIDFRSSGRYCVVSMILRFWYIAARLSRLITIQLSFIPKLKPLSQNFMK